MSRWPDSTRRSNVPLCETVSSRSMRGYNWRKSRRIRGTGVSARSSVTPNRSRPDSPDPVK